MVSLICAGILSCFALCAALACPFYTKTARGLLCLHWIIVNFCSSSYDVQYHASCLQLLPAFATFIMIIQHSCSMNKAESRLSLTQSLLLCIVVATVDILLVVISAPELAYILILSLCLSLYIASADQTLSTHMLSMKDRIALHSTDLFADNQNAIAFLGGRMGFLHFIAILANLFVQVPLFPPLPLFNYIIHIIRSLGTLSMLFTPALFGGSVHAVKTFGAWVASNKKSPIHTIAPLIDT